MFVVYYILMLFQRRPPVPDGWDSDTSTQPCRFFALAWPSMNWAWGRKRLPPFYSIGTYVITKYTQLGMDPCLTFLYPSSMFILNEARHKVLPSTVCHIDFSLLAAENIADHARSHKNQANE